jgi:serine/threonine protein kinase
MANGTLREFMHSDQFNPYLDGPRLVRYHLSFSGLTYDWVSEQLLELAEGLMYLHSQKVAHGDLNDVGIYATYAN